MTVPFRQCPPDSVSQFICKLIVIYTAHSRILPKLGKRIYITELQPTDYRGKYRDG